MTEEKRGSKGGNARKEKLSPEQRKAIATLAAQKRWAKKDLPTDKVAELPDSKTVTDITLIDVGPTTVNAESSSNEPKEKHCPACTAGQSLEEGEGMHILATVEHPVTLPAGFEDSKPQEPTPIAPTAPQKPVKTKAKSVPKEFRSASSYAEKRLPQAIKEKSEHVAKVAQLDAEINDLVRVIKALGGSLDPQTAQATTPYQPYAPQSSPLPPRYPEYQPGAQPLQAQQPSTSAPQVSMPKPMRVGGVGALDFGGIATDL